MMALSIAVGLVLLVVGGDVVVRGAGNLALGLGVRPLVVGLTVVAFCTSAPELAASITAARAGSPELALGNVLGSNVANIGLILGVSGLLRPLTVQSVILSREGPVMGGATVLVMALAWSGDLSRWDAGALLMALGVYLVVMVRAELGAKEPAVEAEVQASLSPHRRTGFNLLLVGVGVTLLVVGADQLVGGASSLARSWGVSDKVVGLTVVAVGTSLPELAASLAAARKGQGDIVLGNVIGSNIFNLLCILGLTLLVRPMEAGLAAFYKDLWVVLGFSVVLLPMLGRRRVLARIEAGILLVAWALYVWTLV